MSILIDEEIQDAVKTMPALPAVTPCEAGEQDTQNNFPEGDQAQPDTERAVPVAVGGHPENEPPDSLSIVTGEPSVADDSQVRIATNEEVAEITKSTPNAEVPCWEVRGFRNAMEASSQKPPWVIEDLLMEQSATLVAAQPHSLKSLSLLYACVEAVAKKKVWNQFAAPNVKATLFIETEDPPWLVESRIRGFAKGLGLTDEDTLPGFHYACVGPFDLVSEEDRIRRLVERHGLNFIVISTLQNLLAGKNWISQEDMQPIMAMIVRLSRRCPVILLTHSPWDKTQRRAAGTITQAANFLTTMHLQKAVNPKSHETFAHIVLDSKAGALETNFSLKLTTEGDPRDPGGVRNVIFAGKGCVTGAKKEAIREAIEDAPDASPKEIAERLGTGVRYVQKIKKEIAGR